MSRDQLTRRAAFTGLLRSPVVGRRSHPELWPHVHVHRAALTEWFGTRLGYRLVVTEQAARLFRLPVGRSVVAPRRFQPPPRRVLVLALLAAAAAEDTEDVTTTQDLSDRVRALTQRDELPLAGYEPDRFAERLLFVKAVAVLVSVGALWPIGRDDDEQREGWAHLRGGVGGAYEVSRELLLRMIDPVALRAAVDAGNGDEPPLPESAARFGVMRRLLELPVCLFADLTEAERVYLASQRQRLLAWCAEMTGWVAEQRAEGIALVATDEQDSDLPFPRLRATDFAALMVLDELLRSDRDRDGDGTLDGERVGRAVAEVQARYPRAITKELKDQASLQRASTELLTALDLLRPGERADTWRLMPAAARFRNPAVVSVTARLDEGLG
jgi:uncharacterized protein (TIGR02678 family)